MKNSVLIPNFLYCLRNLNTIINIQRFRDRSLKARQEQEIRDVKRRNRRILQTVSHHFPDIEIISRQQKHIEAIEELAKPRSFSAHPKA